MRSLNDMKRLSIAKPSRDYSSYSRNINIGSTSRNLLIYNFNQSEEKNQVVVTTDFEKAFDKYSHLFLIKVLSKIGIKELN